jgi:hypothetical protein
MTLGLADERSASLVEAIERLPYLVSNEGSSVQFTHVCETHRLSSFASVSHIPRSRTYTEAMQSKNWQK